MILVKPSHRILGITPNPLSMIELAGRTCYKSEDRITDDSTEKFAKMLIERGHHSVIEHANLTVKFICDRGVTHELVRHRLAAYSQESTRYCNYKGGVTFVIPPWINVDDEFGFYDKNIEKSFNRVPSFWRVPFTSGQLWFSSMLDHEGQYIGLLALGWSPQQARSVLPNSLKTEIVMTCNIREWRHVLTLRTSKAAHPQMRELMIPLLKEFKERIPILFDDIQPQEDI